MRVRGRILVLNVWMDGWMLIWKDVIIQFSTNIAFSSILPHIICIISISTPPSCHRSYWWVGGCYRVLLFLHQCIFIINYLHFHTMRIYDGIIINPQIKVLHILPEIGMVVYKSFTNSWFSYQRSLKLPVKSSLTSITVLASSLLIQMLCVSKYSDVKIEEPWSPQSPAGLLG